MHLDREDALHSGNEREQRRGHGRAPSPRRAERPVEKWLGRPRGPLFPTDKAI